MTAATEDISSRLTSNDRTCEHAIYHNDLQVDCFGRAAPLVFLAQECQQTAESPKHKLVDSQNYVGLDFVKRSNGECSNHEAKQSSYIGRRRSDIEVTNTLTLFELQSVRSYMIEFSNIIYHDNNATDLFGNRTKTMASK